MYEEVKRKSLASMRQKLAYHQMLYRLTNHSKLKQKHAQNIEIMEGAIQSALEEYGWS